MFRSHRRPGLGLAVYFALSLVLCLYFAFASVQGDYGLFRRMEVNAEADLKALELAELESETARMRNLNRRLSDDYLDLDLLSERAREVLGYVSVDEMVLQP